MTNSTGTTPDSGRHRHPDVDDVKLIAFDLDGTLFNRDVAISERTASTLTRLAGRGMHLVVASGRSHMSIVPRVKHLPFLRWAVCSNGAYLHDLFALRPVRGEPLTAQQVGDLRQSVAGVLDGAVWAWETALGHFWTESFASAGLYDAHLTNIIADDTPLPATVLKVFLGHPEIVSYDLLDLVAPVVPHSLGIAASGLTFVEVTAPGVNKGKGLADLCSNLGVASEHTMAFGDNLNDLEMLQWVGAGYAMANAHPRVGEVTDLRTERGHDDDGVAETLERLFDLG